MRAQLVGGTSGRWELGEGPLWDPTTRLLRWVDSEAGLVLCARLSADGSLLDETEASFDGRVGSIAVASDGGLLVAVDGGVRTVTPSGDTTGGVRLLPEGVRSRLNDGTCDPAGRFLVGGIRQDDRSGQDFLYSVEADLSARAIVDGITVSNGIGFTADGSTMYYVDSRPGVIWAFDYDVSTGTPVNRRVVRETGGTPDGLAMDAEDNLWVAFFGEGQVRCLDSAGEVLAVVDVPVPNPTCPEFAGPDLDLLVITTARYRLTAEQRAASPESGALFCVQPGVRGRSATRWAGRTL